MLRPTPAEKTPHVRQAYADCCSPFCVQACCNPLPSTEVKDLETSMAGLRSEKFKAEQAEAAVSPFFLSSESEYSIQYIYITVYILRSMRPYWPSKMHRGRGGGESLFYPLETSSSPLSPFNYANYLLYYLS